MSGVSLTETEVNQTVEYLNDIALGRRALTEQNMTFIKNTLIPLLLLPGALDAYLKKNNVNGTPEQYLAGFAFLTTPWRTPHRA